MPLFNLVYHDCVLTPWMLGKGTYGMPEGQLGLLHALLNGGMPYITDQGMPEGAELGLRAQGRPVLLDPFSGRRWALTRNPIWKSAGPNTTWTWLA